MDQLRHDARIAWWDFRYVVGIPNEEYTVNFDRLMGATFAVLAAWTAVVGIVGACIIDN